MSKEKIVISEILFTGIEIKEKLIFFNGKKITVWIGEGEKRNSFDPAVSICGLLEVKKDNDEWYRVLIDRGTYTYFGLANVVCILEYPKDHNSRSTFLDGSLAVITIKL